MSPPPPIAMVGLACRYPDAAGAGELWETVLGRRRAFRLLPAQRLGADYRGTDPDRTYLTHAAVLRGWEFDRHRFGVPGKLFRAVDLTHWLALQTCAEALSDAGFPDGSGLDRDRAGVLFGNSLTGEFSRAAQLRLRWPFTRRAALAALAASGVPADQAARTVEILGNLVRGPFPQPCDESLAGALSNTIAGRICNHFDFHGTGYTVDGACASSLLAVMTACRALGAGELDFALAGGVDLSLDPFELVGFARLNALAEGREMRVYDAEPTGFLPGEGCGVVALMRAEDARRAGLREYAVLAGWGTSSDGSGGLTRPEEAGQVRALRRAYAMARIDPAAVGLIEGHGTGTAVGDRVELATVQQVRAGAGSQAALGSVKANIGHTKAAAGVAGLIKAALAVHHRVLPPTTGCREPHELLTAADSTVRVLAEPEPWPDTTPVAAVSSMGFGGINAHVVMSGCSGLRRAFVPEPMARWSRPLPRHEIVLLTANDRSDLIEQLVAVAGRAALLSDAELHDLAATKYETSQPNAAIRCGLVADTPERLAAVAAKAARRAGTWEERLVIDQDAGFVLAERGGHRIGLVFPGQAAPVRARLGDWAEGLGVPTLPEGVYVRDGATDTAVAQPAIVRQSLAALAWLTGAGCRPVVAAGHSLGELTALVWAGALSGEDALRLAADRGRIMARHGRADTTMAGVGLPAHRVGDLLTGTSVTVAGMNSDDQTAIAGAAAEVRQVVSRAVRSGVRAVMLPVSHGFHSDAMAAAAAPLAARLREFEFSPPRRPVVSTVTGRLLDDDADLAALLVDQLTAPVRFADALAELRRRCDLLVEAGPGTTLSSLVTELPVVSVDSGGPGGGHALTAAVLAVASAGGLGHWFGDRAHRRFDDDTPITLLAGPCEIEETAESSTREPVAPPVEAESDPVRLLCGHLARVLELPVDGIRPDSRLLADLHLNSLQIMQILAEAATALGRETPVLPASVGEATVADAAELLANQPAGGRFGHGVAGVREWIRAFEHRWRPWQAAPATSAVRWRAHAPEGHWLHELTEKCTVDSAVRCGLAVWLDDEAGPAEVAQALRVVAAHRPDVLSVLHHGHPAAAAVARSAAAELESCVASSVELPHGARDVDLGLARHGEQMRIGQAGEVEHLTTRVRPEGTGTVPLRPGDVCLVTGGVTGITARCAEALAEQTGCTLVVLGRSPAGTPRVSEGMARLGVTARYVQCDVTDPVQVGRAVSVARGHGPVRGLLHGAAVNTPRLLDEVTADTLTAAVEPKLAGLQVLLGEFGGDLTLAVGFSSIIGRCGLAGQAEYCVANELLRAELEAWARDHPSCRTRVLEWSVWSGIGMGERMGVLDSLRGRGVVPIEPAAGARALLAAVADDEAPVTLLVSGRFPPGPTLSFDSAAHEPLRFSADVLVRVPGVETVLEPALSVGSDLYLDDHRVDGVPVLPAVAGLEAMAQAAAATVGEHDCWEFIGIDFAAPVIFDEHESRVLRIAALARGHHHEGVDVVLRDEVDGFAADRFSATVRPAGSRPADRRPTGTPPAHDGVHPYYDHLLFHSGRLRRIVGYEHLSAFRIRAWVRADEGKWFSEFHGSRLLLGDLGAHDAAIHALLACLPHRRALPVHAERLTVWRKPLGMLLVSAEEREHDGDEYVFDVSVTDERGAAVAEWEALRLRAIGPRDWPGPLPASLVGPLLSRRMAECGLAGEIELLSSADGVAAGADAVAGLAWESGGTDAPEPDRLAYVLAQKADEPTEIAACRVGCARRALRDLGVAPDQPLAIEEVTEDGLVVLGAATARVITFAGPLIVAVALPPGR